MDHVPLDGTDEVEAVSDVYLAQLAAGERTSAQHFRIEPGATVPEHSHHHEQAGFVYRGKLTFVAADGSETVVGSGDSYVLAGDEPHTVENRTDEAALGVDVFSPPRTNPDWAE